MSGRKQLPLAGTRLLIRGMWHLTCWPLELGARVAHRTYVREREAERAFRERTGISVPPAGVSPAHLRAWVHGRRLALHPPATTPPPVPPPTVTRDGRVVHHRSPMHVSPPPSPPPTEGAGEPAHDPPSGAPF
jgi:hypothetical protein